ncbi:MAG: hypothetical protein RBR35_17240 [Salinivirgaceae bacterium]|nr:hypothetical protein [Salinivirgaceae bacterium]
MKRIILSIILCLCASCAWAFPPGFIGAITQSNAQAPTGISDNFSSDTSANYTASYGGVTISDGIATGTTNWNSNILKHNTSVGSSDNWVEATVVDRSGSVSAPILRYNGTTGYIIHVAVPASVILYSINGENKTYVGAFTSSLSLTTEISYKVKLSVSGTTFHGWIDLNSDGDYEDTNEDLGTISDSTYSTGTYVGIRFDRGSGASPEIDNFSGGAL